MRTVRSTVLIVDDEPGIIDFIRSILESQKRYRVLIATKFDQAIALFCDHFHEIDLTLLDIALPGTNGIELAKKLLVISPTLRVLFMSGQVGAEVLPYYGIDVADEHFLSKPFDRIELLKRIKTILKSNRRLVLDPVRAPSIAASG